MDFHVLQLHKLCAKQPLAGRDVGFENHDREVSQDHIRLDHFSHAKKIIRLTTELLQSASARLQVVGAARSMLPPRPWQVPPTVVG